MKRITFYDIHLMLSHRYIVIHHVLMLVLIYLTHRLRLQLHQHKNIEKDAALERRFQPIQVDEPTVEDTIAILKGLRCRTDTL
jgi:hypothetical protein